MDVIQRRAIRNYTVIPIICHTITLYILTQIPRLSSMLQKGATFTQRFMTFSEFNDRRYLHLHRLYNLVAFS